MKKIFLSIGLLFAAATVFATTQTKANQDKPSRVFMSCDVQNLNSTTDHYESVYENANGDFIPDDDDGSSENQTWVNYNHVWADAIGGAGSEFNNWQNDNWDWQNNHTSTAGGMNGNMEWDWTGWGGEVGDSNDGTTITGFTNILWIWDIIGNEHCNVSDPVNTNWDNANLDWDDDGDRGSQHDTYTRTADTVWHIQTGGKAIAGRLNLWQFSGSVWEITDKRAVPQFSGAAMREITNKTQIAIGELGSLKADGNLWLTLPDNVEKDITPKVAGKDFYTFNVSGQKYKSYFTVYVDMPGPPPSHSTHVGTDYGHGWWMLGSDASANILNIFITTNRSHFINEQVGYADHGHMRGPGVLRDPETNTNISVTKTYEIGFNNLTNGLAFTQILHDNPGTYNVFLNNCVQNCVKAGAAAGVTLPNDTKPETFGWDIYLNH